MKIQRLLQLLDCVDNAALKKPFLEAALAIELAYQFDLPNARVDSVIAHFEQFHAEMAKRIIGEVNELYPFAVNVTYNMTVDAYKNRYTLCYEPRLLSCEDIAAQLARPAFEASVDKLHLEAIEGKYSSILRSDLSDFIRRFVV